MSYTTNNHWTQRITNANKEYDAWQSRFKCDILERYWECDQWRGKKDFFTVNYMPYTINLFYSTIKIKLASLLFQKPSFLVSPRPGNSSWDMDSAVQSAELKQDTLNTIIQNPNCNFTHNVKLAALESFFRFGLIEVGYAADWRNPLKQDPLLSNYDDPSMPDEKARVVRDDEVPVNERFYFKRIPARRFRTAVCDATQLDEVEWCGYYEYYYTARLKKTKGIKWPEGTADYPTSFSADTSGIIGSSASGPPSVLPFQNLIDSGEITKCWHIWDNLSQRRLLFIEDVWAEPLWEDDFERLPFIDIRWDLRLGGWYPIPPSFQWLSAQDEINEAREQTRSYRRRFTRKFQSVKGSVAEEEKEKFAAGPDGIIIEVGQADAITPIQNPEQGQTAENALLIAKDDFNIISGTSAEARGQNTDRETATQAKIVDSRSQIRESAEQLDFSTFLCLLGREILAQAGEKLSGGLWVKYTTNPIEQNPLGEVQVNQPIYKYIKAQDLSDGYDFDVDIDVMNQTPAAMQAAQQSFTNFLALLTQFPMISMSPILIREAAYRCGYRNERVIHQMQQVAALSMAAKASQAAAAQGTTVPAVAKSIQGQNPNNAGLAQLAQMGTPTVQQTDNQLDSQVQ